MPHVASLPDLSTPSLPAPCPPSQDIESYTAITYSGLSNYSRSFPDVRHGLNLPWRTPTCPTRPLCRSRGRPEGHYVEKFSA